MKLRFDKYQGAGNDFIIVNCLEIDTKLSQSQIELLCNRHFGIGADGLMSIHKSDNNIFTMKYYNSDGVEGSMCGNGGRCIALYAHNNKISENKISFDAIDGIHHAEIKDNLVKLSMNDVVEAVKYDDGSFLNTGSPHFVKIVSNIDKTNANIEGKLIADDSRFAPERTNVNFVEPLGENEFKISTFERGVENETLACGTGAVAVAIALGKVNNDSKTSVKIIAKGGLLEVEFKKLNKKFTNVFLSGPAEFVYSGEIEIKK